MRLFEIILLITLTLLPFLWKRFALRFSVKFILIGLVTVVMLQLVLEGYRWQLLPAYVLAVILAIRIYTADVSKVFKISVLSVLRFVLFPLLLIPAWILPAALPVFDLPEPRGPYAVGTDTVYVDTNRDEPITANPNDTRKLVLKIWYPADSIAADAKRDTYVDPVSRTGFATKYGLPASALNYLDYVDTYVYPKAAVANGAFPVLLFSHGYGSKATGYYALLSEVASQGYIVINMNHTYESLGSAFPDGEAGYFNYAYQQQIAADQMQTITPIQEVFKRGLDFEQRHPIVRDAIQDYFENDIQNRWVTDMQDILDRLPAWNADGFFEGSMRLDQLGVFGHSVGGGAAGKLALTDERIRAGVNLDGIQWGTKIDTVFQKPFLYISADWPAEHEDINAHIYSKKSTDYFYEAKLLNSGHPNFMDIPFMVPVPALAGTGSIDAEEGIEIVSDLVTRFFDFHLKKKPEANLQDFEKSGLLEFQVFKGDSVQ
ncbi:platelet-activating factor acetylhydrolase isoform II [Leeuwenhoekiella aestuarii]|uniref:Platelet-activating factor acetylhydrolase isoform II n=1 Tax=Leeuwenhoekiella aestuarii TaxID=2249426 RepID=A0A4Q0NX13_9FLAO|nr:hypothetical protein [Leeuwenhoekiella aestuarii]RXG15996.1 platelet-activating factor acetylhydrolase isoform II [Leeuwenhoekiella aestuarii]RXG16690.1 platelet-activating factor acetylhydrolase isoform II [Leeuwenhoekiella aestuarii]